MIETDIIIIGAGPCGLFTVFEAGIYGPSVPIMFDAQDAKPVTVEVDSNQLKVMV